MEEWIEKFLEAAGEQPGLIEYLVMGGAAFLEYVVPPVPGDLVVLLGAFLVGAKEGWSLPAVMVAVNVGALLGMTMDYAFGCWVARHDEGWRERYPRWRKTGIAIDRVERSFRRWGSVYIVLNRFVPGIRAVFFVAAGMSGVPYWKVLLWGLISALAWSALIFAVGISVGYKLDSLKEFFRTYSIAAWVVVVCFLLVVGFRLVRAVRAGSKDSSEE